MGKALPLVRGIVVACLLLALPAAATAATRYASPTGTASASCPQASPCDVTTAINGAASGDTVLVKPGTYGSSASPLPTPLGSATKPITIDGTGSGSSRPVIYDGGGIGLEIAGTASDLEILDPNEALALETDSSATRMVAVAGPTTQNDACSIDGSGVSLTDSVCWAQNTNYNSAVNTTAPTTLRNDTLVGYYALFNNDSPVTAINCILDGRDRLAEDAGSDLYNFGSGATTTLTNDEYDTVTTDGVPRPAPSTPGQVTTPPQFVNAANGDFHEAHAAPSIDGGTDDPANGTTDLDATARTYGSHTDIGAYEFIPAVPTATAAAASGVSVDGATLHGMADGGGTTGSYHFIYGTSAGSLTSSTPSQSLSASASAQSVSAALTGLQPGTTYTYELVVSTVRGTATSTPLSFTTDATTTTTTTTTTTATTTTTTTTTDPPTTTVTTSTTSSTPAAPTPAAPSVTVASPAPAARFVRYARVTARYACADGWFGPGLRSCTGTVSSGRAIDTSKLGHQSFTVTAVSQDGQTTRRTVTYTVIAPDNRFTVSRVRTPGGGTVAFTAKVPGPGTLRVSATPGRTPYGSLSSRLRKGGTYRFVLRPNAKGRGLIAAHRYSIVLRLVVQYTPTGGYARRLGFFRIHPVARPRH